MTPSSSPTDSLARQLQQRIADHSVTVGIIGLGYVGLPLAMAFVEKGIRVTGFDVDPDKPARLLRGESYIRHLGADRVTAMARSGRFDATTDFGRLGEPDAVLICVPTPLTPQREPDMAYVVASARQIRDRLRPGQLVVLESTTYPGTTDELVRGILQETGLACGRDFFLAFSPEREDPGREDFTTTTTPKVVGGVDAVSGDLAQALYDLVIARTVRVSSARAAEASKLTENIFRAVNIALVNELKVVYDRMGIDVWEVLDAAESKPFGFMRFNPGPGWGGHCLRGGEWVRVRGLGLNGPVQLEDLFDALKQDHPAAITPKGLYLRPRGLEALTLDPRSGDVAYFPVEVLYRGFYEGSGVCLTTEDNRRLCLTDGHPMLVRNPDGFEIVSARDLQAGQQLPVCSEPAECRDELFVDLVDVVPPSERNRVFVRVPGRPLTTWATQLKARFGWQIRDAIRSDALRLDHYLEVESEVGTRRSELLLLTGMGQARRSHSAMLRISPDFARFIGYFLAEGCITRDRNAIRVRLTFNRDETESIEDVRSILVRHGFDTSIYYDKTWHSATIKASSLLLGWLLKDYWQAGANSKEMRIPSVLFDLTLDHKTQLLAGLLRGDGDVWVRQGTHQYRKNDRTYRHRNATGTVGFFSSSPQLLEQVVHLLQDLGFRPRIKRGKTHIQLRGAKTLERLEPFFADSKRKKLVNLSSARVRQVQAIGDEERLTPDLFLTTVHSVEKIEMREPVFSLEVGNVHTFTASTGIVVHNCIPLDPFYLSWKAREYGEAPKFIELAGDINVRMPHYVVDKLQAALNDRGRAVKGAKVLVLGLAYKRDIDDPRESPAFEILDLLLRRGAEVAYHDPHIPAAPRMRTWPNLPPLRSLPLTAATLAAHDAVLIVTDHRVVDYELVAAHAPLIVDTRGIYRQPLPNVVKA